MFVYLACLAKAKKNPSERNDSRHRKSSSSFLLNTRNTVKVLTNTRKQDLINREKKGMWTLHQNVNGAIIVKDLSRNPIEQNKDE